jgi:hypothetical protein
MLASRHSDTGRYNYQAERGTREKSGRGRDWMTFFLQSGINNSSQERTAYFSGPPSSGPVNFGWHTQRRQQQATALLGKSIDFCLCHINKNSMHLEWKWGCKSSSPLPLRGAHSHSKSGLSFELSPFFTLALLTREMQSSKCSHLSATYLSAAHTRTQFAYLLDWFAWKSSRRRLLSV